MLSQAIAFTSAISPLLVVLYVTWKEYRSGSSDLAEKIKNEYRERNEQLDKKIKELQDDHHKHSVEIGKLQAVLEEKEKQIVKYETIFANRNPELTETLKEIRDFMKDLHTINKEQITILRDRQKRDKMIDNASKLHKGAPMMAPVGDLPDNII